MRSLQFTMINLQEVCSLQFSSRRSVCELKTVNFMKIVNCKLKTMEVTV